MSAPVAGQGFSLDENGFREALHDVQAVCHRFKSFCTTVDDLEGMIALALSNDGQLRLLFNQLQATQPQQTVQGKIR